MHFIKFKKKMMQVLREVVDVSIDVMTKRAF